MLTETTKCPQCGQMTAISQWGGERGESGPFLCCGECGYDEEDQQKAAMTAATRMPDAVEDGVRAYAGENMAVLDAWDALEKCAKCGGEGAMAKPVRAARTRPLGPRPCDDAPISVRERLELCVRFDLTFGKAEAEWALAENERLRAALRTVRLALTSPLNSASIVDTVWVGPAETAVDFLLAAEECSSD